MAKRSKFFCIAVEGATCDGRSIDRGALEEMAATYNQQTYAARVNCEHLRGLLPDGDFGAYGDVVALETREVELSIGGKTEKKLGLFAQVDALDSLLAVQAKGQKLYCSIEINPNFAASGKAYLQGLAVTDSPASLGTEIMAFAAGQVKDGKPSPFADRKLDKGNFVSEAREVEGLDFSDVKTGEGAELISEARGLFATMKDFFSGNAQSANAMSGKSDPQPQADPPANDNVSASPDMAAFAAQVSEGFTKITAAVEKMGSETTARIDALRTDHDALKHSVETTDSGTPRRTRASGAATTDLNTFA